MTRTGPVLIEEGAGAERVSPAEVPPVPDMSVEAPSGQAMRTVAALTGRRGSVLGRWFWRATGALFVLVLSVSAWGALEALMARSAVLGWIAGGLLAVFVVTLLGIVLRELAALARLQKVGALHRDAEAALLQTDLGAARDVVDRLQRLYAARPELAWHRARFAERRGDMFDADALFHLAEAELLAPLDTAARVEVEAAARQVATVTAIVPLALADVVAALTSNVRMIRRIAEIYGGRAGTLGAWRLIRAVMTHLVATGAVAVGDDLIGSVAGGGILARVSRRFGEGVVNGALTARVGVAAMEVCRPLPFSGQDKPQIHRLIGRALSGLFPTKKDAA